MKRPKVIKNIDIQIIIDSCESYLNEVDDEDGHVGSDDEHYLFESVMEAVYGSEVWKYINEKMN